MTRLPHILSTFILLRQYVNAAPLPSKTSASHRLAHRSEMVMASTTQAATAGSFVTGWVRPQRQAFDSTVAPFIDIGPDVTWYVLGTGGVATTLAGERVMTIQGKGKNGNPINTVATVGDVMVLQQDVAAEAIGIIGPGGQQGELFDLIACNTHEVAAGLCIMVDYDGTDTQATYSATIAGQSSAIPVQQADAAPADLAQWAAGVMRVQVETVQGGQQSGGAESSACSNTTGTSIASTATGSVTTGTSSATGMSVASSATGSVIGTSSGSWQKLHNRALSTEAV